MDSCIILGLQQLHKADELSERWQPTADCMAMTRYYSLCSTVLEVLVYTSTSTMIYDTCMYMYYYYSY